MSSADDSRQSGLGILAVLLVLAAVVVVAAVLLGAVAALRVSDARQGWDRTFGSWDEILERYPPTDTNGAALELERLAAEMGLFLAPRDCADRVHLAEEPRRAFRRLKSEVFGVYDKRQLEQARRGEIDAPPLALTEYVESYGDQLAVLRRHLIAGSTPVWESDPSKLADAPLPNLLGTIDLHKLLTNVALLRLYEGDVEAALENVEASHRFTRSLHESPILISQLIMIAATRMQLGVLRHVPRLPERWVERMEEHDYRRSFVTSLKYEGWAWLYADVSGVVSSNGSWRNRVLSAPALRPYTKLCLADMSDAWRERVANLESVETLCDRDLAECDADLKIPVPRWNAIGEDLVPDGLAGAIDRLARLELDLELTRLIVEADARRGAGVDAWTASLPAYRASRVCPDDRWIYREDGGSLHIDFSREITWPEQRGAILPTRAVLN